MTSMQLETPFLIIIAFILHVPKVIQQKVVKKKKKVPASVTE